MAVAVALFTMAGAADARKGGAAGNGLSSHQSASQSEAVEASDIPAYPMVSTQLVRNSAAQAADDLSMAVNNSTRLLMRPGVNQMIPIAMYHPNRIVTPFKHPQVISTTLSGGTKENECGEVCVRGNVVYISTDKNYPVTQAEAWETSMPFVEMVREGFHLIAKGEVPPGYTLRNVRASDVLPV